MASFVSQVSYAPTKPFTDAFPDEAEAQQQAFETPSYAQVRPTADAKVPTAVRSKNPPATRDEAPAADVREPHYHLPSKLLEDARPPTFEGLMFAGLAVAFVGIILLIVMTRNG